MPPNICLLYRECPFTVAICLLALGVFVFQSYLRQPCAVWPTIFVSLAICQSHLIPIAYRHPHVYIQLSHIYRPLQYAIEDSTLHLNSMHCHSVPISLWGFNTLEHTCHFVITPHLETYHIYFLLGSSYPEIKPNKIEMWLLRLFLA